MEACVGGVYRRGRGDGRGHEVKVNEGKKRKIAEARTTMVMWRRESTRLMNASKARRGGVTGPALVLAVSDDNTVDSTLNCGSTMYLHTRAG
jgi:hypothetical protein